MGRSLGRRLRELETAALVAVSDPDPAAAAAAAEELQAPAAGTEELVARPDVQAVLIASPGAFHRPLTELAAAHGKHVFVEKPLATTLADCDAMIAAARQAGVLLMVGQVLRFYPCWRQVLELVRRGEIGQPWAVSLTRLGSGWGGWPQPWRNSLALSGGLLMEVNAHEFDFMCQVCGPVERVYAEGERCGDDPADYPNLAFVSLRFRNGAVGMLHTSTVAAVPEISGRIQGSEGSIQYLDGFDDEGLIRCARRGEEPRAIRVGDVEVEDPVRAELRRFVDAVRTGGPSPIPAEEGRRNVEIALAAYESVRTGRPVAL
jgi:predicted dehydrogenase